MALSEARRRRLARVWTGIAAIIASVLLAQFYLGLVAFILAIPSSVALALWCAEPLDAVADSRVLQWYLLTMAALSVHMIEEYLAGFPAAMRALFEMTAFSDRAFVVGVVCGMQALFAVGAWAIASGRPVGRYFAWFVFIGPGGSEWAHYVFPLLDDRPYGYFPGMWTACLPMIPGLLGLRAMRRLSAEARSSAGDARLHGFVERP